MQQRTCYQRFTNQQQVSHWESENKSPLKDLDTKQSGILALDFPAPQNLVKHSSPLK